MPDRPETTARLGHQLATGLRARIDRAGLRALIRLFLANRGVWESGRWLGPTVSVAHTSQDVETYLDAIGEFTEAVA